MGPRKDGLSPTWWAFERETGEDSVPEEKMIRECMTHHDLDRYNTSISSHISPTTQVLPRPRAFYSYASQRHQDLPFYSHKSAVILLVPYPFVNC